MTEENCTPDEAEQPEVERTVANPLGSAGQQQNASSATQVGAGAAPAEPAASSVEPCEAAPARQTPTSQPDQQATPQPYATANQPAYATQQQTPHPYATAAQSTQQPPNPYAPYQAAPQDQQPPSPYAAQPGVAQPYVNQPYNGQPVQMGQPYAVQTSNGKAVAALVFGILAILFAGTVVLGLAFGVVAIALGVSAAKQGKNGLSTGGKICGIIGLALTVLALVFYIAFGTFAVQVANDSNVRDSSNASSVIGGASATADEKAVQAAAEAKLDLLKDRDAATVQAIAAQADAQFQAGSGYSFSELGVDPVDVVNWMLQDFSYVSDGAYAFDTTGTAFADVVLRDGYAFSNRLNDKVNALQSSGELAAMADEATLKARVGQLIAEAMVETTETTSDYVVLDATKANGAWAIDEDSWNTEVSLLLGL